jgi:sulfatase modifying factor 1
MKRQIILYMLCVFAAMANAQPIPKSVYKTPTPKPVKITQKIVVRDRPVYIVKNNDRDGDGLTDAIDECPDEKGSPKNNGCPEKTVSIALPEMIVVTGGSFTMGSKNGNYEEKPSHSVILSSFSMAKTETTVEQWRAYCNASGKAMPEAPGWGWNDNDPIVNVSWNDAVAYCNWLRVKTGKSYRLPTEAEWEYAARGGNKSNGYVYAGGDNLNLLGWSQDNSSSQAHACGLKRSNELGLFDMSGNVWEWCKDWFDVTYYAISPSYSPQGPSSGSKRVMRGGCWYYAASQCRVAYRTSFDPAGRDRSFGFRVVLSQ